MVSPACRSTQRPPSWRNYMRKLFPRVSAVAVGVAALTLVAAPAHAVVPDYATDGSSAVLLLTSDNKQVLVGSITMHSLGNGAYKMSVCDDDSAGYNVVARVDPGDGRAVVD